MRSSILGRPDASVLRESVFPSGFGKQGPVVRACSKNKHADEKKKARQRETVGRPADQEQRGTANPQTILLNGEGNNQTRRVWGNFL